MGMRAPPCAPAPASGAVMCLLLRAAVTVVSCPPAPCFQDLPQPLFSQRWARKGPHTDTWTLGTCTPGSLVGA